MSIGVLCSVAMGTMLFLMLHLLIWRFKPSNNPRITLLTCLGAIEIVASEFAQYFIFEPKPIELGAVLGFDVLIVILYLFLYAGLSRSVSVTLLVRLLPCGLESVDPEALCQEYLSSTRFEDRLHLMQKSGWVSVSKPLVKLTPKGRILIRGVKSLACIFSDGLEG